MHTGHGKAIQAVERSGAEMHWEGKYAALNSIPKPLSDLSGTFALVAQTRKGQGRNEGWDGKKKSILNGRKVKRWLLFQAR